ncbi:MAG: HD domain-containing protein [Flavobacteriales bacterium]|nr:HD domain-containing protein [Flavobacteriales bacterium]
MRFEALKSHVLKLMEDGLPSNLHYHGLHHTLYVYEAANRIADHEKISGNERELLMTGVILHDIGFLETYHQHEEKGAELAAKILPKFRYSPSEIMLVQSLIMRTKVPQIATNKLEEIICDADLDYLGTDQFLSIGNLLFKEFLEYGIVEDEKAWNRLQVNFLSSHTYFTSFAKSFRAEKKNQNLDFVKKIVETYTD